MLVALDSSFRPTVNDLSVVNSSALSSLHALTTASLNETMSIEHDANSASSAATTYPGCGSSFPLTLVAIASTSAPVFPTQ